MNQTTTTYTQFFEIATGHKPYLWQCRLACGEPPEGIKYDLENLDKATWIGVNYGALILQLILY